jgi:AP-1-like factor
MESFPDVTPIWDLSNPYTQLPDDDFMTMLQKQFPQPTEPLTFGGLSDVVNPQSIERYSLPSITPPSEDSSPSPPNSHHDSHDHDDDNSAPKRKASVDDLQEGPSQKSQHTLNNDRKAGTRRKSTGNTATPKDEGRLMKRKEQNRAAQRAFRERKEKHVKDLEDKVAALEAKNEEAVHENENLRDLLTRLQNENLILKQTSFTFSVPKNAASSVDPARGAYSTDFGSTRSPIASTSTASPPKLTNPLDWSSLTTFDPSMLNLLDDGLPQPTATEGAMQMDFGFGSNSTGLASNSPYTTIASNPSFMTFASTFDTMSPPSVDTNPTASTSNSGNNVYNFDMNNLSTWANSPQSSSNQEFDDLLSGYLGNTNNNVDFSFMNTPSSLSPISHHLNKHSPAASSSSSSPSFSGSDPLFSSPRESMTSDSDAGHDESECPKTKSDLLRKIVETGPSPFGPPMPLRKRTDSLGAMITCKGSSFPKTAKSDQNVEVLSAWRSITSNPNFKDTDINSLCQEFTNKARCDGTKVVLEPQGVHSILESLSKK